MQKVVDTVEGNSAGDEGLIKGGVVSSNCRRCNSAEQAVSLYN